MEQVFHGYAASVPYSKRLSPLGTYDVNRHSEQIWPSSGALSKFRVRVAAAPGAGKSYTFTVYKNGGSTSLQVVISGTDTTGADDTNSVSLSPGDTISVYATSGGGPAATSATFSFLWTDDTASYSIILGADANGWEATRYYPLGLGSYQTWGNGTENYVRIPVKAGTFKNLYMRGYCNGLPAGWSQTHTLVLRVNGVSQTLTTAVTEIGGTQETDTDSDTTHEISVSDNDEVCFLATFSYSDGPRDSSPSWGLVYDSSEALMIMSTWPGGISTSATRHAFIRDYYFPVTGEVWRATESERYMISDEMLLTGLYIKALAAPGAGKSYNFVVRKNGASTGLTVTISGTDTTGSGSGRVTVSDGDVLDMQHTPSGSPASTFFLWNFTYIAPSPSGGGDIAAMLVKAAHI